MKRFAVRDAWLFYSLLLATCLAPLRASAEVLITARVEGETFVNTTPEATFCRVMITNFCTRRWSVELPITFSKSIDLTSSNDRSKVYVQLPAPRAVTLQNQSTGQTLTMQLTMNGISQRVTHQTVPVIRNGVAGGCNELLSPVSAPAYVRYLWGPRFPPSPQPCMADAGSGDGVIQESQFLDTGVLFTPQFPAAADMAPGLWEGVTDYPLLAGQGFDFGEIRDSSAGSVRVRVQVQVLHDMRVDFPAANTELALNPPGGWQDYLMTNKAPERLYHNSPIRVWAASTFAVYLICEYTSNARCAMRHPRLTQYVPVTAALSLPGQFRAGPLPVDRTRLYIGEQNATLITPDGEVSNQPGMLHFDVAGSYLANMIRYRGDQYRGNITIVFDANP